MTIQSHGVSPPTGIAIVGRPFVDALLDSRTAFASPDVVANHAWLSREEKRLILWSWARDVLRDARGGPQRQPGLTSQPLCAKPAPRPRSSADRAAAF